MKEKLLYWSPRILSILVILFMIMFSFDVFGGNAPIGTKLLGFLMHNIPAIILTGVLILAWKWEVAGGILFILAAIAGTIFFRSFEGNPGSLIVLAPFCIIGILFIVHHMIFRNNNVSKVEKYR
jgi:hypothetical protein